MRVSISMQREGMVLSSVTATQMTMTVAVLLTMKARTTVMTMTRMMKEAMLLLLLMMIMMMMMMMVVVVVVVVVNAKGMNEHGNDSLNMLCERQLTIFEIHPLRCVGTDRSEIDSTVHLLIQIHI
jgi:hypothetical protein